MWANGRRNRSTINAPACDGRGNVMPELIKSIAPTIPEVRCPGCLNLMTIKFIETMSKNSVELTYRCKQCEFDTKRTIHGKE